jgi:hypothetical protein
VTGGGRLLSVSVDGRRVVEVDADTTVVMLAAGEHILRVELVTSSGHEYAPPVLTDENVSVGGVGVLTTRPECAS